MHTFTQQSPIQAFTPEIAPISTALLQLPRPQSFFPFLEGLSYYLALSHRDTASIYLQTGIQDKAATESPVHPTSLAVSLPWPSFAGSQVGTTTPSGVGTQNSRLYFSHAPGPVPMYNLLSLNSVSPQSSLLFSLTSLQSKNSLFLGYEHEFPSLRTSCGYSTADGKSLWAALMYKYTLTNAFVQDLQFQLSTWSGKFAKVPESRFRLNEICARLRMNIMQRSTLDLELLGTRDKTSGAVKSSIASTHTFRYSPSLSIVSTFSTNPDAKTNMRITNTVRYIPDGNHLELWARASTEGKLDISLVLKPFPWLKLIQSSTVPLKRSWGQSTSAITASSMDNIKLALGVIAEI